MPVKEKLVVLNPEDRSLRQLVNPQHFRLVLNPDYHEGIAASIRYGVWACRDDTAGYLFYLADMPLIQIETLHKLLSHFDSTHPRTILVPMYQGKRGNPVLVGRAFREALLNLRGDVGARSIFKNPRTEIKEIPVDDPAIHWDMDTEDAYQDLVQKIQ